MAPTRFGLAVSLILAAACAGPAPATPTASLATAASPTPEPSPTVAAVPPLRVTPAPPGTPKQESMRASTSVVRHGIRLTLRVSPNPLEAGHTAAAWVTLQNVGDRELRWLNDGCDTNAGIHATVEASWRDSHLDVSPELDPYRKWFREKADLAWPISLGFGRGLRVGSRPGSGGCADLGLPKKLGPGAKVTQEFLWDGNVAGRLGKPPSGPASLTATFERWSRPGPGKDGAPITVRLDSWILNGRSEESLSPAEVIDAALADERLASWLITRPLRSGADAIVEYDRDLGVWVVGLLTYRDDSDPVLHAAFVDAVTGEVFAIREHTAQF